MFLTPTRPKEMEDFINANPGLQSRFNRYIHFTDYSAEELYDTGQTLNIINMAF